MASGGFGYPSSAQEVGDAKRWKPIFSVAELGGYNSPAQAAELEQNKDDLKRSHTHDVETAHSHASSNDVEISKSANKGHAAILARKVAVVSGVNRPLFHIDLTSAVQSAIQTAQQSQSKFHESDIDAYPTKL